MRDAIAVEALKARRSRLPWLSVVAFAVTPWLAHCSCSSSRIPTGPGRWDCWAPRPSCPAAPRTGPAAARCWHRRLPSAARSYTGSSTSGSSGGSSVTIRRRTYLALPTPRTAIAAAKFAVTGLWCLLLAGRRSSTGPGRGCGAAVAVLVGHRRLAGAGAAVCSTALMAWLLVSALALAASVSRATRRRWV